mmetsp:Transcript_20764/g.33442  ORF Transcript_20764/g.33442 Transcript_20764/m.33442 type:complete len:338 (-) Transcript_20764:227-1240(-)
MRGETARKFPAPVYINLLFEWVEGKLQDDSIFPVEVGVEFPPDCIHEIKGMMKRLFRVYAHIYHKHFAEVQTADMTAALNSCLKHFVIFGKEFELIYREDLEPMKELVAKWKLWKKLPYKNAKDSRKKGRRNSRMKRANSRKTFPTATPTPMISELTDNENGRSWIQNSLSPPLSPRDVVSSSRTRSSAVDRIEENLSQHKPRGSVMCLPDGVEKEVKVWASQYISSSVSPQSSPKNQSLDKKTKCTEKDAKLLPENYRVTHAEATVPLISSSLKIKKKTRMIDKSLRAGKHHTAPRQFTKKTRKPNIAEVETMHSTQLDSGNKKKLFSHIPGVWRP